MTNSAEEPQAPAQVAKRDETGPSVGSAVTDKAKTGVLSPASKAKVSDEKRDVVNVTVLAKDITTARKEIETTLTHLGGKIIKTESFENKELVIAEIDSKKMKEFIDNLKHIGEIKERELTFEAREGDIQIRVEILKKAAELQ